MAINTATNWGVDRTKQPIGNLPANIPDQPKSEQIQPEIIPNQPNNINQTKQMNIDAVPPKKRKAILVISSHELTRLEYTPGGNELLLSEQIHLLVPSDEASSSLEKKLENSGLLEEKSLLIQNPYDSSDYVVLEKSASTFALAKYLHFTTLCGFLGAREVTVEQIEVKTSTGKQLYKGSLNSSAVTGNLEAQSKTLEQIRNQLKIRSTFPGGNPNIEEAEAHLNKYQLLSDHSMTSLIAQRSGSNPLQSRELTLSLSEEFKKNFKAVADINVPVYLDLQAQIEQLKKEVYEFTLTVKVEF